MFVQGILLKLSHFDFYGSYVEFQPSQRLDSKGIKASGQQFSISPDFQNQRKNRAVTGHHTLTWHEGLQRPGSLNVYQ